jgi:hypothetical protein
MRRSYIFNPQINSIVGRTLNDFFNRSKIPPKYKYIIELIKEKKLQVITYGNFSSVQQKFKNAYLQKLYSFFETHFFKYIEIYLWMIVNKINPISIKILFDIKKIKTNDVIFLFSNLNLDNDEENAINLKFLKKVKCKKIIHLSHYNFKTKKISDNCKYLKDFHFISENNLKKNSKYFSKYFNFYNKEFLCLPFAIDNHFKNYRDFQSRSNKCLSVGSFQVYSGKEIFVKDLLDYYNEHTLHPVRKKIYDQQEQIKDYISCINSPVEKNLDFRKRKYYQLNLVQLFNTYKMFICGEELGDLSSKLFAEGMKCGSVYFGNNSNHYEDLGMVDGIHYVKISNNIDEIYDKIIYYQKNISLLEKIAINGKNLVDEKFNTKKIIDLLEGYLKKL